MNQAPRAEGGLAALGGLQARLLVIICLAFVPAVLLALYSFRDEQSRELSEVETNITDLSGLIAQEEVRLFDETRELLIILSQLPQLVDADSATCSALLGEFSRQLERYDNLGFIDLEGRVTCSAVPISTPVVAGDREYYQHAVNEREFSHGRYQIGRITGEPGINFGYPVIGDENSVRGVVYAAMSLRTLSRLEMKMASNLPEGAVLYKIDEDGVVLARSPPEESLTGQLLSVGPAAEGHPLNSPSVTVLQEKGVEWLRAVAPVETTTGDGAIRVVLDIPTTQAFAEVRGIFYWQLSLLAVSSLLVLLSAWYASREFVARPLRLVIGAANSLATGSFRQSIGPPYRRGEIGILEQAFDNMAKSLRAREEERDQAEQDLRKSREDSESLIRNAPVGIFRSTEDGRLLQVNPRLVEMLGYPSESALLTRRSKEFYANPRDREKLLQSSAKLTTGVQVPWKMADGTPLEVSLSTRRVQAADGRDYFETFVVDETRRRALERKLRETNRREALGRLAGGVAHDFNNLLVVILGYAELLLEKLEPRSPIGVGLRAIQEAGQRAARMTNQLLAFSRRQVVNPRVLDVNEILRGMEGMLRRLVGESIHLQMDLAAEPMWALIDVGQLEQVVLNLVANARDAMPMGGELRIAIESLELEEPSLIAGAHLDPGAYVSLSVKDTGAGMDSAMLQRIFEPLFTTKAAGRGTGIGLGIVEGIIQESGGSIGVESEPGRGTTFQIWLPCSEAAEFRQKDSQQAGSVTGKGETVLLVEDDEAVRKLARTFLATSGYHVLTAATPAEAQRIAREHSGAIALMVADVVMPGMSGPDLAQRLAAIRPDMRVLYVSGYTEDQLIALDVARERILFLAKPFTQESLARKVREALDRPAGEDPAPNSRD